jgi:hypothetical protein
MTTHTITVDLKWFCFSQNNSGGHFVTDANCAPVVFIQARNAAEAITIGERFMDNSDSCPCCGDRWSFWVDDGDGYDTPHMYGEPFKPERPFRDEARLHHFDGRIETIKAA